MTILLPSPDTVVAACLEAIPVGPDEIPLLDDQRDLHRLDHTQMQQSRLAKNLINAAEPLLPDIKDQGLAQQLGAWITLKRRLV